MRIAYVITRADDLGGAQIHVRDIARALKRGGLTVSVFGGRQGILADQLRDLDVPYVEIPGLARALGPLRDARALSGLRSALRAFAPTLISTHCAKAGVLGRLAARSLGIPSLFTAHGWAFSDGVPPRRRSLYRWMERSVAPLARRVIVVCEADRRTALRDRVVSIDQLRTVHNGMPDIDPAERARPGSTPVRLLTIARLAEQKDYRTLLHALARLRDLDWHLEQIGDGPQRGAIRALADELKLSQRITWSGLSPDPIPSLARAQVYALISNWEGFPRSILEAMRAGLPVVASDVGGVRESVEDGATGFVVPRGDVDRLADRMRRLIESSALRSRFGSAGRARYERHFTFERMLADTWSVYLESIGAASGRRLREISPAGGERPCETQPRAL